MLVLALLVAMASCVTMSASMMIGPAIALAVPPGKVQAGEGDSSDAADKRLAARKHAALATATRDALDAAAAAPADVRLQRRAAAMVRALARDEKAREQIGDLTPRTKRLLDHLVATAPCPGLADAAATWLALDDEDAGGGAYVQAARQCQSVEAAIAAVRPLRRVERCETALAALREVWPRAQGARSELAIEVLDGVTACSTAITLRRNLSFVPPDVVDDYFALLEARREQEAESERRAEVARREQEAQSRAFAATSRCESECSAAVSTCTSSCGSDTSCNQRCYSVGHVCRSGCGSY
ncbi:MAG TPA: hypothetical protein VIV11_38880 [Kofleriaceae bacterium]